ncbi:MAG: hypothetical protein RXP27_06250 [Nitrososphaeria archaeon]
MAGAGPDKRCDAARRFTTRTGLLDLVTIPIETLPRRALFSAESPLLPVTIRSAPIESACCSTASTGSPTSTDPSASTPLDLAAATASPTSRSARSLISPISLSSSSSPTRVPVSTTLTTWRLAPQAAARSTATPRALLAFSDPSYARSSLPSIAPMCGGGPLNRVPSPSGRRRAPPRSGD